MASFRFGLLLSALLASACQGDGSPGQVETPLTHVPSGDTFLPEDIEATGDTTEVKALRRWATEHQYSHPERAERIVRRALVLSRDLKYPLGVAGSLVTLGHLAAEPNQKEAYYIEAHEVLTEAGHELALARNQINLGNVYEDRGELREALSHYFDALEILERLNDPEGKAAALTNIGNAHQGLENYDDATSYYEQAIRIATTLDKPDLLTGILINAGNSYAEQDAYERAEIHLRRALELSNERGSQYYTAVSSINLVHVLNQQRHFPEALRHLLTAERLGEEIGDDELLFAVYDESGKSYMGLDQYDQALYYAHRSLDLAHEAESADRQMKAYQALSQLYETTGNHQRALRYHQQYASARDSVFTTEKAEIITEMQTRYDTEEKQRANDRLEQENRIQILRQNFLLAGVGGLLLLLVLLFSRYRHKQRANRLLVELDGAKSRFFANISHEFRTPLTVILGGLQDALGGRFGKTTEKLTEQHQAMLRNTRHLQRLIDEVLDLNRLKSGKLELSPALGDLVRSLQRIVEANAPLAERNGIDLTFEPDVEHCPRLYDQEKLEKIVGNLLSNALKFTPKGGSAQVALRCKEETEIIVSDDGPGIPAEAQEKVFERFAQVEDGALQGGTGIGLALAKELAELHGGTIALDSKPREGSMFTVRFPLEKATLDDVVEAPSRRHGRDHEGKLPLKKAESVPPEKFEISGNDHPDTRLRVAREKATVSQAAANLSGHPVVAKDDATEPDRTTVLIIEDNDDVRAYIYRSLEETYRILEATDGETGLQRSREVLPDLVVSDVMLPGIDGYQVARRLKAEPATECIPVVMLTARAAEEDQTEGYGSGAEVYITKPFLPETLRAALARLLEERRRLRRLLREETEQSIEEAEEKVHTSFRHRARIAVLKHLYDENFGVEELAATLGMSRRTLHRRVKQELELSPSDFLRTLRLERARELLSNGAGSVSEVAYAVGFNSRITFSRAYTAHYGKPPSTHLDRKNAK